MPLASRAEGGSFVGDVEVIGDGAERMGGEIGEGFAGEREGIDPGGEAVKGEGAKKPLFGASAVGDDGGSPEARAKLAPEVVHAWSIGKVIGGDTVDFLSGPGDRTVGGEVAHEEGAERNRISYECRHTDLDRDIGRPGHTACGFEIDGGEGDFVDRGRERKWGGGHGEGVMGWEPAVEKS